jgi:hypothetical protein
LAARGAAVDRQEDFVELVAVVGWAVVVLLVPLAVWRTARRVVKYDAELYEDWCAMQRLQNSSPGSGLVQVVSTYQRARRGTKAVVMWLESGYRQDSWFALNWPKPGATLLVQGSTGWGPHNRNPEVFYVKPNQILYWMPPGSLRAVERHKRRQAKSKAA